MVDKEEVGLKSYRKTGNSMQIISYRHGKLFQQHLPGTETASPCPAAGVLVLA